MSTATCLNAPAPLSPPKRETDPPDKRRGQYDPRSDRLFLSAPPSRQRPVRPAGPGHTSPGLRIIASRVLSGGLQPYSPSEGSHGWIPRSDPFPDSPPQDLGLPPQRGLYVGASPRLSATPRCPVPPPVSGSPPQASPSSPPSSRGQTPPGRLTHSPRIPATRSADTPSGKWARQQPRSGLRPGSPLRICAALQAHRSPSPNFLGRRRQRSELSPSPQGTEG